MGKPRADHPGPAAMTTPHRPRGKRGGSTTRWRKIRAYVLDRDGHRCQIRISGVCIGTATHAHHVKPKVKGGSDDPANLAAACAPCNLHLGDREQTPNDPAPVPRTSW